MPNDICMTCHQLLGHPGQRHTFNDCIRYWVSTHPRQDVVLDGRRLPPEEVAPALEQQDRPEET